MHKVTHDWGWEGWSFRLSLDSQLIRADFLSEGLRRLPKGMVFYLGFGRWVKCGSTETEAELLEEAMMKGDSTDQGG